ncbi:hypothetical protein F4810DRAFT_713110 [Camillea tinctor]|nr:hypothetical protein F4810DRAFT_713110 [Camillea tinctor]
MNYMAGRRRNAQSVIEFLTAKNPRIIPEKGGNRKNTSRHDWHYPTELREWEEFDYETLEVIFGGELLKEAHEKRDFLPHYPHLDREIDITVGSHEPSTITLYDKWNHTIVLASLRVIQDKFHPCLWRKKLGAKNSKDDQGPAEGNAEGSGKEFQDKDTSKRRSRTKHLQKNKPLGQKRKRPRQPDGGSVSVYETGAETATERFPKEYKPAYKWNSQRLRDGLLTDKITGEWLRGMAQKNENAPLRQAYTYCVDYQCRYGCILTTEEAFIFRIKPRGREDTGIAPDQEISTGGEPSRLLNKVKKDGLMQYASIPWANGCDEDHEHYRKWTVNLALWFVHQRRSDTEKSEKNEKRGRASWRATLNYRYIGLSYEASTPESMIF